MKIIKYRDVRIFLLRFSKDTNFNTLLMNLNYIINKLPEEDKLTIWKL